MPAASSSVAGALGMNRPVQSDQRCWRPTRSRHMRKTIAWGLPAIQSHSFGLGGSKVVVRLLT